jgi:molybdopterin-guanine dinucleotide biosynthesis protein A
METDRRPVAVVLAGGLARRMGGGDKPLRVLAGRALLDHVLDRVRPQVGTVALSANGDPARFAAWGLPVLADALPGHPGPLAGVLAGMRWAAALGAADVLSVPADTPFLPADLVVGLAAARRAAGVPIACAASLGRAHPVVALWPVALADALAAALRDGVREVARWAAGQGVASAEFDAAGGDPFFNVNSPEELAQAEVLLATPATTPAGCRAPDRPGRARSGPPATPSARRSR